ncbi:hypothetical protein [Maritalea porphyrae]|jgi:hypothetical protein|uniref:hypothetical protein n=1 Tax=Maritalea porphyrae TaxID=880732 RepID=UPI0022AED205|nr:hypothetical protein [Maritalea porphyrae]MCZ4271332.1 hypothetical protein [Maritalea porphyrae]
MSFFKLKSVRPIALIAAFSVFALSCSATLAYSTSPVVAPESGDAVEGEQFGAEERIVLPDAPEREDRQGYLNLDIHRDLANLPAAVATTREELMAAAKSGDTEMLRAILKRQTNVPVVSFGDVADPIDFLRESSNDGEGRELLAIMIELMEAPYSIMPMENGEPEIYVWPAYATNNLENLSPSELIDVYKIVSHQDLEEMQLFGGWYFFRVGIDANGEWRYFVAGD